ncbi:MAG TPA: glycosyltransferase [Anaerolineae bacterium]|nr:glycosyltransferase [Anaerolineae bacterium]
MTPNLSVVICVYNGADTLADCLRALQQQTFPRDQIEIIVVDDGSTDDSAAIARRFPVRVEQGPHRGLAAARNIGWRAAQSEWVAFTDDDCAPTRHWLQFLWCAIQQPSERVLGAAGRIIGFPSAADPPRYVELRGGFNTDAHLSHPQFPYAPMGNALYRRAALEQVNGLDERYSSYESCDLHTRLRQNYGGAFYYEPRAIVLHRHYNTWAEYFRQQRSYGRGMAQFMWHYRAQVQWSFQKEIVEWGKVFSYAGAAILPSSDERALLRRGDFIKHLALRVGFAQTYWSRQERMRW